MGCLCRPPASLIFLHAGLEISVSVRLHPVKPQTIGIPIDRGGGDSIPVSNFTIVDGIPQQPPITLIKLRY
jgi:hypothetical protein